MNPLMETYNNRLKPWWSALDSGSKFQFTTITLAFVVALIVTTVFVFRPKYETLYVGLEQSEAGQIVEKLKESKVPYKLENGGATISVPRKDIYDIRLRLASEGLPRSGAVGYEIFDKSNLGMTDFLQKVNFRRALEGELAKSICSIGEVKSARVHLVIPEPRLFQEDRKEATASVILNLRGARSISNRQVEGIAYLVASSVEGLNPDNVTILDSSGRLLSEKNYGSGVTGLSSSQLEMQKNVESYLESKARGMLDPIIGASKSVVTVSAELNFEQVEKTMENYDPDNLTIRSEERTQEKSSESNIKEGGNGKTTSNSVENVVTNYEVNKTVQHVISQMGNIKRLSVAMVVDGSYKAAPGEDGTQTQQYVPRSQEELDKFASIVKGAVGYNIDRNDIFEIANVAFDIKPEVEEKTGFFDARRFDYLFEILPKIGLIFLAVFIFFKIRKKMNEIWERQRIEAQRAAAEREIIKKREEIVPKINTEPQLVDHLRAIANEKPMEIAKVVKTMMAEE